MVPKCCLTSSVFIPCPSTRTSTKMMMTTRRLIICEGQHVVALEFYGSYQATQAKEVLHQGVDSLCLPRAPSLNYDRRSNDQKYRWNNQENYLLVVDDLKSTLRKMHHSGQAYAHNIFEDGEARAARQQHKARCVRAKRRVDEAMGSTRRAGLHA